MLKKISIASLVTSCLFTACGEREEANAPQSPTTAGEHATHPSDWIPDDTQLAAGRSIYVVECSLCHDEGEEGAPSLSDGEQWNTRRTQGEAILIKHAIEGFIGKDGEMPARGGTDSLSDEEVTNAVRYMLEATGRTQDTFTEP